MATKIKIGIVIGRWQPMHNGHLALIQRAIKASDHVIVCVGSAGHCRTTRNPFNYEMRKWGMYVVLGSIGIERGKVDIIPINDHLYMYDRWEKEVYDSVDANIEHRYPEAFEKGQYEITLFGTAKDHTTKYLEGLNLFKHKIWYNPKATELTGSMVRDILYRGQDVSKLVPKAMNGYKDFRKLDWFKELQGDYKKELAYKKANNKGEYPTLYHCTDNLLVHNGEVLLIQRKNWPGKGMWALPGGFLEAHERIIEGAIRETKEETGVQLYSHNFTGSRVFDDLNRCTRGRVITHTFLWEFIGKPKVKAADDAADAKWFKIADLAKMPGRNQIMADHFDIIENMHNEHLDKRSPGRKQ